MKNRFFNKILSFILAIFFITLIVSCNNPLPKQMPEDFSFSIQWGILGKSYYNSETGELIKSKYEDNKEDFKTTCFLTKDELENIYSILVKLDIDNYDDIKTQEFRHCDPGMKYELEVKINEAYKIITLPEGIDRSRTHITSRARKIQRSIDQITEIIYQKEEWKALPEEKELYY